MNYIKNKKIEFEDLGIIEYGSCYAYQEKLMNSIIEQKKNNKTLEFPVSTSNFLLFVEHPHV